MKYHSHPPHFLSTLYIRHFRVCSIHLIKQGGFFLCDLIFLSIFFIQSSRGEEAAENDAAAALAAAARAEQMQAQRLLDDRTEKSTLVPRHRAWVRHLPASKSAMDQTFFQ